MIGVYSSYIWDKKRVPGQLGANHAIDPSIIHFSAWGGFDSFKTHRSSPILLFFFGRRPEFKFIQSLNVLHIFFPHPFNHSPVHKAIQNNVAPEKVGPDAVAKALDAAHLAGYCLGWCTWPVYGLKPQGYLRSIVSSRRELWPASVLTRYVAGLAKLSVASWLREDGSLSVKIKNGWSPQVSSTPSSPEPPKRWASTAQVSSHFCSLLARKASSLSTRLYRLLKT
ncbi:hypothetical protein DFH06DRAFT_1384682 [Mycena polygramma]|nr:hypothetical protein DFH06DRAFT_1384682 [Mycena polygramma]